MSYDDYFSDLHPDRGGGEIPAESVNHGLNADISAYPETSYIRCKKCNYIFNKARFPKGWGTGITYDISENLDQGWGGGPWGSGIYPNYPANPTVTAGCPFCGSFNYD